MFILLLVHFQALLTFKQKLPLNGISRILTLTTVVSAQQHFSSSFNFYVLCYISIFCCHFILGSQLLPLQLCSLSAKNPICSAESALCLHTLITVLYVCVCASNFLKVIILNQFTKWNNNFIVRGSYLQFTHSKAFVYVLLICFDWNAVRCWCAVLAESMFCYNFVIYNLPPLEFSAFCNIVKAT